MNPTEFIIRFTSREIINEKDLYSPGSEYFLINNYLRELITRIRIKPEYLGTFLGRDTDKGFIPSFFLLEMIRDSSRKVVLNEKSAWLFICGRNALKESIIRKDRYENMDYVLVLNERNEVLGYGQFLKNEIRNLFDRGDFLRRERKA